MISPAADSGANPTPLVAKVRPDEMDSVAEDGTGTLTLGGANTYTGATVVDQGTLSVTGILATPALTVSSGTLAISGNIESQLSKNGGGGGIRTHGTFRLSSFQDWRNRPLYHPSVIAAGQPDTKSANPAAVFTQGSRGMASVDEAH